MPPTPPSRSDPANFAARGDAFLGWFPTAWTYLSNLVTWLSLRANEVEANSNAAVQAASTVSSVAASSAVQNAAANAAAAQLAATGPVKARVGAKVKLQQRVGGGQPRGQAADQHAPPPPHPPRQQQEGPRAG